MGELRLSSLEGETIGCSLLMCRMQGLNSFSSRSSFLSEEKTSGLMQCGCRLMKVRVFYIFGVRSRMSVFMLSLSLFFLRFFLVFSA